MKIFYSIKKFIDSEIKIDSFIPTMGNLHDGHLSLIEESKKSFEKILERYSRSFFNLQKRKILRVTLKL